MAGGLSNDRQRSSAYRAASKSTNESVQVIREFWRENGAAPVDECGDTLLHFLAIHGNEAAFGALVEEGLVTGDDLRRKNASGDIPLHEAARFGRRDLADTMLRMETDLVFECNNMGETPLYVAAASGKKPVFDLLVGYGSDCLTRRRDGCTILHAAVMEEHYSLAISILESYPELACRHNTRGRMALNVLATKRSSFRSGSLFVFTNLGTTPFMFMQIFRAFIYLCIPALYVESTPCECSSDPYDNENVISRRERCSFTNYLLGNGWLREINDAKQRHTLAVMLARRLVKKEYWSYSLDREDNHSLNPLIQATKLGINELVMETLEMYPEAVESLDKNGRTILHIIAEQKNRILYDYVMKTVVHKDRMLTKVDVHGNTILHAATAVGSSPYVPQGVFCKMSCDVVWFKRIKYDVYPRVWDARNSEGKTAEEVYEERHLKLRSEAENASRERANSGLVVAALLGTMNFAAVFTLPGGFNSTDGKPVLIDHNHSDLRFLVVYLGLALLCCAVAMGFMISIVLSKFSTEDFHISLPVSHIMAAIASGGAVVFTALVCRQAFLLEGLLTLSEHHNPFLFLNFIMLLLISIINSEVYLAFAHLYCVISRSLSYKSQYV